jgi:hypothetical protein
MKHGNLGWISCLAALSAVAACAGSEDGTGGNPSTGGSGGSVGNDSGADSSSGGSGGSGATGGSTGGTSGSSGASGSAGAAGSGGGKSDAATTSVSGNIVALIDQVTPVTGMQVCVYGDSSVPCATTDQFGAYTITGMEADKEILLEFTKLNYFPALVTVKTRPTPINIGEFPAPTTGEASLFASIAGVTLDSAKGQMLATAVQPGSGGGFVGQDGVTITVTPDSGAGPFFTDDQNLPDLTLTTTGPNGLGLWANVNPGDVQVAFTHPTKTCTPLAMAWPGTAANAVRMTVVAGYLVGGGAVECQ